MYEIPICDKSLLLYGNCPCAENPPTINGLETLVVEVNEEFDPLNGVSATDCEGNPLNVTVHEPVTPPIVILDGVYETSDGDTPVAPEEYHRIYDLLEPGDILHLTMWNEDKTELLLDIDVPPYTDGFPYWQIVPSDGTDIAFGFSLAPHYALIYRRYGGDTPDDYRVDFDMGDSPKYVYLIKEQ